MTEEAVIHPVENEERLAKAPLALVVCQVRFETNLIISDARTARELQEALGGRARNITVQPISGQAVNVALAPGIQPTVMASPPLAGWRFTSDDGQWIISLLPDFLSLETTAYTTWEQGFGPRLQELLAAVAMEVKPVFEQRLGLRYINRITGVPITQASDWAQYLAPELAGPLRHPVYGRSVIAAQQHMIIRLDEKGEIAADLRHGVADDGAEGSERAYLLDIDVHRNVARAFDVQTISDAAYLFRGYAVRLFQSSLDAAYLESLR